MSHILFTKKLDSDYLKQHLEGNSIYESQDFIQEEKCDISLIKKQLPQNTSKAIVTSLRGAKAIEHLNLNCIYYCVGTKAANFLTKNNYIVKMLEPNAKSLVNAIDVENLSPQAFVYFCSNIRQETIKSGLERLGHKVEEIIVYKIKEQAIVLERDYDTYVFFSPSGVKSFFKLNKIPREATIFAIGSTTAKAVESFSSTKVLIPTIPTLDSLMNLINTTYYA